MVSLFSRIRTLCDVAYLAAATVLVAFTDRRQVLIYSIPHLELLHTLQHEQHSTESVQSFFFRGIIKLRDPVDLLAWMIQVIISSGFIMVLPVS